MLHIPTRWRRLSRSGLAAGVCLALFLILPSAQAERSVEGQVSLLERALQRITRTYLHPEVIDPASMARDGIQAMEHAAPGVLVSEVGGTTLHLHSGTRVLELSLEDVDSLSDVEAEIQEAAAFLASEASLELEAEDLHVRALQGLLRTIDRHSRLIVGGNLDEFNTRFKGTLVGIGARIGRRQGMLRIIEPFVGAPAAKAGLLPGDGVSHIDGHPTAALSVEGAVERIRGPEGVPVVLTVQREREEGRRVFVIVRAKVRVPSVKSERLADDIGFIRIDHFSQKTSIEVAEHLTELTKLGALHGLIIDVRENTGGSMRHAARIVNYFVPEGTLVRTEGADGQPVEKLTDRIEADERRFRFDGPLAVLVDSRTASGSEIVAGGLKYLERSITIGAQTFGKGTVQKVYPLRKEGKKVSMKLTVARYLLPGDAFINSVGVTPDVVTGPIWLDPDHLIMPDRLREPTNYSGRAEGRGGLDSGRNPGGGRAPTTEGSNRAPLHRLAYPRISDTWAPLSNEEQQGQETKDGSPREAAEAETARLSRAWPDLPGDGGEPVFNDLDLRLAHQVLRSASAQARRTELLELAGPIVASWEETQAARLQSALSSREILWDATPTHWLDRSPEGNDILQQHLAAERPPLELSVELPESLIAGGQSDIRISVRNPTGRTFRQLRARMESSTSVLRGLDFLLGDLHPGSESSWSVTVDVPDAAASRNDNWRVYLIDEGGALGAPFSGTVTTQGRPAPAFEARLKSNSEKQSDGSSVVRVRVQVRNRGQGDAGEVQLHFGTPEDDSVERLERWASIESLPSGEEDIAELNLRVRDAQRLPRVDIRLRIRDRMTQVATTFALKLPSAGKPNDTGWLTPPEISLLRPMNRAGELFTSGGVGVPILGSATSDDGLEVVEVLVGRDKIFASAGPASPEGSPGAVGKSPGAPSRVDIEARGLLQPGPNRIRVKARTSKGVEATKTTWVLGSRQSGEEE